MNTDSGQEESEDGMCMECAVYHDPIDLGSAQEIGAALRAVVSSALPSRVEIWRAVGPRVDLADHYMEIAARALVNAANVICPDDWIPAMPDPKDARSKEWARKK